jgi:hypothetical protein
MEEFHFAPLQSQKSQRLVSLRQVIYQAGQIQCAGAGLSLLEPALFTFSRNADFSGSTPTRGYATGPLTPCRSSLQSLTGEPLTQHSPYGRSWIAIHFHMVFLCEGD